MRRPQLWPHRAPRRAKWSDRRAQSRDAGTAEISLDQAQDGCDDAAPSARATKDLIVAGAFASVGCSC